MLTQCLSPRFLRRSSVLLPSPLLQIPLLSNIIHRPYLLLPFLRLHPLLRTPHPHLPLLIVVPEPVRLLRCLHALVSVSLPASSVRGLAMHGLRLFLPYPWHPAHPLRLPPSIIPSTPKTRRDLRP